MLKISKAISAAQAKKYYRNELSANRSLSVSNGSAENSLELESSVYSAGEWRGKLADKMNLTGQIKTADFERLCDGLHPLTSEELVRRSPVKTYANRFGREITTMGHRSCWDATFSAPKSVSLASIVGGDERILEAHRESARLSASELERYAEARMGGSKTAERTGKFVSALFEHQTARPDQLFGYSAPQLHTHTVVFNLTETAEGVIKPMQPLELYKSQKYATAVYRIELADRLRKLGYEIEIDPKTKAPEIKGFSSEYLKENSLRSQELNTLTDAVKLRFAAEGRTVVSDAGIKQIAAWQSRTAKSFDIEAMRSRAIELEVKYDFEAQRVYNQALENTGFQIDPATERQQAKAAVDFVQQNLFLSADLQQNSAATSLSNSPNNDLTKINERQFLTEVLEKGTGTTTFAAVQNEYAERLAAGEFSHQIKSDNELSTSRFASSEISAPVDDLSPDKSNHLENSLNLQTDSNPLGADSQAVEKTEQFSMDDLENAVRKSIAVENEAAQVLELLFI